MHQRTPSVRIQINNSEHARTQQKHRYLDEGAVDEPLEVVKAHHVIVHVPPHLPMSSTHCIRNIILQYGTARRTYYTVGMVHSE